jgi:hypothetical protein
MSAACPLQTSTATVACENRYDQLDDIRMEKVSLDVYIYYAKAFGFRSILLAFGLYCCHQVS